MPFDIVSARRDKVTDDEIKELLDEYIDVEGAMNDGYTLEEIAEVVDFKEPEAPAPAPEPEVVEPLEPTPPDPGLTEELPAAPEPPEPEYTPEQVSARSAIEAIMPRQEEEVDEDGIAERAIKGVGRGAFGTLRSAGGAMQALGMEESGKAVEEFADEVTDRFLKVQDPGFFDQIAEGFGSAAAFFIPGIGVYGASSRLALVAAPKIAAMLGTTASAVLESMVEGGAVYQEALEKGESKSRARASAGTTFLANLPLNYLLDRWVFTKFPSGKRITGLLKGAGEEAVQEAAQEVISNFAQLEMPEWEAVAGSALVGGIVGAGIGGVKSVSETLHDRMKNKQPLVTKEEAEAAPDEEVAEDAEVPPEAAPAEEAPTPEAPIDEASEVAPAPPVEEAVEAEAVVAPEGEAVAVTEAEVTPEGEAVVAEEAVVEPAPAVEPEVAPAPATEEAAVAADIPLEEGMDVADPEAEAIINEAAEEIEQIEQTEKPTKYEESDKKRDEAFERIRPTLPPAETVQELYRPIDRFRRQITDDTTLTEEQKDRQLGVIDTLEKYAYDGVMVDEEGLGMPMRRMSDEIAKEAFENIDRFGDFAYVSYDVVNMDGGNRTLGHEGMNWVIKRVGNITREVLAENGVATRPGGDEGAAIAHITPGEANRISEEIENRVENFINQTSIDDVYKAMGKKRPADIGNLPLSKIGHRKHDGMPTGVGYVDVGFAHSVDFDNISDMFVEADANAETFKQKRLFDIAQKTGYIEGKDHRYKRAEPKEKDRGQAKRKETRDRGVVSKTDRPKTRRQEKPESAKARRGPPAETDLTEKEVDLLLERREQKAAVTGRETAAKRLFKEENVKLVEPESKEERLASAFAKRFGLETVYFVPQTEHQAGYAGAFLPRYPQYIFINQSQLLNRPVMNVVAHEVVHAMRDNAPKEYAALETAAFSYLRENGYSDYRDARAKRGIDDSDIQKFGPEHERSVLFEELVAELVGEFSQSRQGFWKYVTAKAPNAVRTLIEEINRVTQYMKRVARKYYKASVHFTQINKLKETAGRALSNYEKRVREHRTDFGAGKIPTARFSKVDQISTSRLIVQKYSAPIGPDGHRFAIQDKDRWDIVLATFATEEKAKAFLKNLRQEASRTGGRAPLTRLGGAIAQKNLDSFMKGSDTFVNESDGSPRVFYHGSLFDFTEFDPNSHELGLSFFSVDPNFASQYRGERTTTYPVYLSPKKTFKYYNPADIDAVMKSFEKYMGYKPDGFMTAKQKSDAEAAFNKSLSSKKPLTGTMKELAEIYEESPAFGTRTALEQGQWALMEKPDMVRMLKDLGYDSMLVREAALGPGTKKVDNIAMFNPNQIKSAIANVGAYSPDVDDIRLSKAEKPFEQPKKGDPVESDQLVGARELVEQDEALTEEGKRSVQQELTDFETKGIPLSSDAAFNRALTIYRIKREKITKESMQEVKRAVWSYGRIIGLHKEATNRVDTLIRDARTDKDLLKAIDVMDEVLRRKQQSRLFKQVQALIKSERTRIKKAARRPSKVAYAFNKRILDYINSLTAVTPQRAERLKSTLDYLENNPTADIPTSVASELTDLFRENLYDMNAEQLREVIGNIKSLRKHGRLLWDMKKEQRDRENERTAESIAKGVEARTKEKDKKDDLDVVLEKQVKKGSWAKLSERAKELYHQSLRPETVVEYFDGWKKGKLYNAVYRPFLAAMRKNQQLYRQAILKMENFYGGLPMRDVIADSKFTIELGGKRRDLTTNNMMFVYAMSQNEKGRAHLRGTGITEKAIEGIIAELDQEYKDAVDKQIDYYDTEMYPQINEVFKKYYGVDMPKENRYFPIIGLNTTKADTDILLDQLQRKGAIPATISAAFTKARMNSRSPFAHLDYFTTVGRNMISTSHYIAYQDALNKMRGVMEDPKLKRAMMNKNPQAYEQIKSWMSALAQGRSMQPDNAIERSSDDFGSNFVYSVLGLNLITAFKQPASFVQGLATQDPGSVMRAALNFMRHPIRTMETVEDVSDMMQFRAKTFHRALSDLYERKELKKIFGVETNWEKWKERSLGLLKGMDRITVSILWSAKFNEVLGKTGSEEKAIDEADYIIRTTQPMGGYVFVPHLYRQTGLAKAYTYFTQQLNQNFNLHVKTASTWGKATTRENITKLMLYSIIPSGIIYWMSNAFRFPWEDPEGWSAAMLDNFMGGVPLYGQLMSGAMNNVLLNPVRKKRGRPKDAKAWLTLAPPTMQAAEELLALTKAKDAASMAQSATSFAATMAGVPYAQAKRTYKGTKRAPELWRTGEKREALKALIFSEGAMKDISASNNMAKIVTKKPSQNDLLDFYAWWKGLSGKEKREFIKYLKVEKKVESPFAEIKKAIAAIGSPKSAQAKERRLKEQFKKREISGKKYIEDRKKLRKEAADYKQQKAKITRRR